MTWTYTDPSASYKDAIRLTVGDTDTAEQQLSDEEIAYLLSAEGGVAAVGAAPSSRAITLKAAAACCDTLAAKYSRQVDFSVGGDSESASRRAEYYRTRAEELRKDAAKFGCLIVAGGRSISEKQSLESDTDAIQPLFKRGQHNAPGSGTRDGAPDTMWSPVYPRP